VLELEAVEPCPSPIAGWEAPFVPVAVAHILNAHVGHVRRVVSAHQQRATLAVGWQGRALVDTCYALMAERLQSPHVRLVACQECGRVIHAPDPRQMFCAPRVLKLHGKNKSKSTCYERHRQRALRVRWRAEGLDSRGKTRGTVSGTVSGPVSGARQKRFRLSAAD
jgi:hypothetical protein